MKKKYYKFNRRAFKRNLKNVLKPEFFKRADISAYAEDYERGCIECGWVRGEYEVPAYATKSGHAETIYTN